MLPSLNGSSSSGSVNNCTGCQQDLDFSMEKYHYDLKRAFTYANLFILVITALLNFSSFFIFFMNNFKSKFEQYLKIYSFISMFLNLSYLVEILVLGLVNKNGWFHYVFYILMYFLIGIVYTFKAVFEFFLVYERIQLFNPRLKFCADFSVLTISLFILVFSILINTLGIMRYTLKIDVLRGVNRIIKIFEKFVILIIEIFANVVLVVTMKKFYLKKKYLQNPGRRFALLERSSSAKRNKRPISQKKFKLNNVKISFLLSFILTIYRFLEACWYLTKMLAYQKIPTCFRLIVNYLENFLILSRLTFIFFIFYFLNRKFRSLVNQKLTKLKFKFRKYF